MLGHKHQIVEHAHIAQRELSRVTRDAGPVALQPGVKEELGDAEDAAQEVQQDLADAPALGAAVPEVIRELGSVLDQRDEQLDVRDGVDDVEPRPRRLGVRVRRRGQDDADDDGDGDEGPSRDAEHEA